MSQAEKLIPIGSEVRIEVNRVRKRMSNELVKVLDQNPNGTVVDYKMTDGMSIGLIVRLSNGAKVWFFKDEIGDTQQEKIYIQNPNIISSLKKMEKASIIQSEVKINLDKVNDNIPNKLIKEIEKNPIVTILGYKITDGGGLGLIVKLRNGTTSWFFENEIDLSKLDWEPLVSNNNLTNDKLGLETFSWEILTTIIENYKIRRNPVKSQKVGYMLNPFVFFRWLLYSLGDIF